MSHNRASYQHHNPNMSTKQAIKPKTPCLSFKGGNGTSFHQITETNLHLISKAWPEMKPLKLLIAMLNGKSFQCGSVVVSIVYK